LPEDFYKLPKLLKQLIRKFQPEIIIGTGWDYVSKVKVEKIALNVQNSLFGESAVPDNYNHKPEGEQVVKQGPLALRSTLPSELIIKRLKNHRIPAFVSYQAGTHCCNTVMYSAIYYSSRVGPGRNMLTGFIHIPPVSEMKLERSGTKPMRLDKERSAIEIALKSCRDYLKKS
jgi:pyroglutamyl-peptidase